VTVRPVASLTPDEVRPVKGLLFDLDDTLLTHGALTLAAYEALFALRDAGLHLVAVTGRPSSWGQLLALQWPIDAALTENGALVALREGKHVVRIDRCTPDERAARRAKLAAIVADVRERMPDLGLTDDASGRVSDVTWDIGETVTVPPERIAALREIVELHGARWSTSSVHFHATFDPEDKASGAVRFVTSRFGEDATAARSRWAFVGDSGNDRSCFAAFDVTFGVSNVSRALGAIAVPPRFVASAPMGEGFAEISRALLRCKMA
jgi:HAD superfamily hydrolase (TIGR01484 family)